MYANLRYGPDELGQVMRRTYDELIEFVTTPAFLEVMAEMFVLRPHQRPEFVTSVLLQPDALAARGVVPPKGVLIQRSAFGDRRPTLFCVKKFLPDGYRDAWENVNLTFDNEFADADVSRSVETSWRWPLDVAEQASMMAAGRDLESVEGTARGGGRHSQLNSTGDLAGH